jgi:hypothetical protein
MEKKHFLLSAKIVSILYILLLTMLAFDTPLFSIGFLIHLIPTAIFLGIFILVIYKNKIGGTLFVIAGIWTIFMFKTYNDWFVFIVVSLIPKLLGITFFFSKNKN